MPRKSATATRKTETTVEQDTPVSETVNSNRQNTIANLPAAPAAYNIFAAAAASLPSISRNFAKHDGTRGSWTINAELFPLDEMFVLDNIRYGYKFLMQGQPVEDYAQEPGKPFLQRHQLGVHDDQSQWPLFEGNRVDPVKPYIAIDLLRIRDGSYASYDALNTTGRRALTELIRTIAWQQGGRGPEAKPIIKLGSRSWEAKFRTIFLPTFEIMTWAVPDGHGGMRLETNNDRPSLKDELNDDLPF